MPDFSAASLLDVPAFPAEGFGPLADRIGRLLGTANDVLLVQGEAVIALEAVASSLAAPGLTALNIVTSPYGAWFGGWLRRGGAQVIDLAAEPGLPVAVEQVDVALAAHRGVGLVSLVHAESATGILNPLPEIAALARRHGALLAVDAVASAGGHAFDVEALGVDVAVIGPQKALAGPAGVSAVSVSARAWERMTEMSAAPSALSLPYLRESWLRAGRGALPGMPSALELHALDAALGRVEQEGLSATIARHARAATATRSALRALGLPLWVPTAQASNLTTGFLLPETVDPAAFADAARPSPDITPAVGPVPARLWRLSHTGRQAGREGVLATISALSAALARSGHACDIAEATGAVARTYG